MQSILYYTIYLFAYCFSLLPFWFLYRISDVFYLIIKSLKYRDNVIRTNLTNSFPELNIEEIIKIRNQYYQHLCDLFIETIKLLSTPIYKIQKRVQIENVNYINEATKNGKDVIAVLGHYNNWEWVPIINTFFSNAIGCAAYHPLKNPAMNRFMIKLRSRFNSYNIPLKSTNREIITLKKQNQRYVLGLISDQSPGFVSIQHSIPFLNQNTPILLGAEKLSKLTNAIVVFFEMRKIKRGHYKINVVPISDKPKETSQYEITQKHVKHLELLIKENPQYWLWSHRRWKFANMTKEEFQLRESKKQKQN